MLHPMTMDATAWLSVAAASLSGLAAGMTALNMLTWPRAQRAAAQAAARQSSATVSILIPARNEEDTISACVLAALAADPLEVVVYNDGSTDATGELLAALAQQDDRLRVVQGCGLPEGWIGKPHACHQLAQHARGEVLFFLDADTFVDPQALTQLMTLMTRYEADAVTAVPRQLMGSFAERLILPLLHLTYTSWFPLMLTWRSKDVRFLAANGQIMAIKRRAYERVGGFAAVRQEVVDDMAICRALKGAGHRVVFADGDQLAQCRMYGSARQVWEGFSKNIYEGLGGHPLALLGVLGLYALAFVAPYILAPVLGAVGHQAAGVAALALGFNLLLRLMLAQRHHHSALSVLLHPMGVLGLLAIAVNSALWHHRGKIVWSGRAYQARAARQTGQPEPSSPLAPAAPHARSASSTPSTPSTLGAERGVEARHEPAASIHRP